MTAHLFDQVDLRVTDIARARPLHDAFMPAVGLSVADAGDDSLCGSTPGANRIAFWANSEEEVNRVGAIIREAGAQVVEGPEYCFDDAPGYYAVFFEDLDGNKWEVCCRNARVRDPSKAPAS